MFEKSIPAPRNGVLPKENANVFRPGAGRSSDMTF